MLHNIVRNNDSLERPEHSLNLNQAITEHVEDTGESANQEQYVIHPTKSGVLLYSNGVRSTCDQLGFDMGGKRIKFESQCNHLGIFRDIKQKVNIEEKISLGRKTAYALMGTGLHSGNGLTKPLCAYLWSTYVIPRVVYGLEVQKLSRTDMESLEKFQRKCLRQIQGLPDLLCFCSVLCLLCFVRVCLYVLCGHLLGKG